MITIRRERPADSASVRAVNLAAFATGAEADLVDALRADPSWLPDYSLVADADGDVVGHLVMTRAYLTSHDMTADEPILAVGPMGVLPERHGHGVGSALVGAAVDAARHAGESLIVVLGHPWFYLKFGFVPARPLGIQPPAPWPDQAWMALPLSSAGCGRPISGTVRYPAPFDRL